jgi:hypothetical protein
VLCRLDWAQGQTHCNHCAHTSGPRSEYRARGLYISRSPLVALTSLRQAVLYCHTNMSQALSIGEGLNNVYGRTLNPHNVSRRGRGRRRSSVDTHQRDLVTGGSSSGEGALIAMRGSLLGVGSDVGGSIREPVRKPYWTWDAIDRTDAH